MSKAEKKNRKTSGEQKKRLILKAAVEVFAKKGFHRCRILDIATQAGVAYGLVYHYFKNKEEILNSIFDENWGLLTQLINTVEQQADRLDVRLLRIVSYILDAYQLAPEVIQVMVIEIARSSKFLKKPKIQAFETAFIRLSNIFAQHQAKGEIRKDLDPKLLAYCFFGMVELVLTGYLLETLQPEKDQAYESLKSRLVSMFLTGIRTP